MISNLYYKAVIIKTILYWYKVRSIEQNREPEINSHIYGKIIYNKAAKNTKRGKNTLCQGASHGGKLLDTGAGDDFWIWHQEQR